jgi:hypothetical protein
MPLLGNQNALFLIKGDRVETFVLDLAFSAMWYRLLVGHAPLDARVATEVAHVRSKFRSISLPVPSRTVMPFIRVRSAATRSPRPDLRRRTRSSLVTSSVCRGRARRRFSAPGQPTSGVRPVCAPPALAASRTILG